MQGLVDIRSRRIGWCVATIDPTVTLPTESVETVEKGAFERSRRIGPVVVAHQNRYTDEERQTYQES